MTWKNLLKTVTPKKLTLTGIPHLTIPDIISVARDHTPLELSLDPSVIDRSQKILDSISSDIKDGIPIYGVSTGYGARAADHYTEGDSIERLDSAVDLTEAILHVDVSTGPLLPQEVVRAAMLIRLNMLLPGYSGVRLESLRKINRLHQ